MQVDAHHISMADWRKHYARPRAIQRVHLGSRALPKKNHDELRPNSGQIGSKFSQIWTFSVVIPAHAQKLS